MAAVDQPSAGSAPGILALPGVRTFRSRRFREVTAVGLWAIGLVLLGKTLAAQVGDPAGQFAIDFADYHGAAREMVDGRTPYAPAMLEGPVPSQGQGAYRYPPPFAQLLAPLTALPLTVAAWLWLALQAVLIFASVWLAGSLGGARSTRERFLWSGVAATYFLPAFDALWKGNVSGVLAFQVALLAAGRVRGGFALASALLLKVSPAALVPAVLVRGAAGRRAELLGLALGTAVIVFPSFVVFPGAWLDYGRVLPNLLAGSTDYLTNLAPASILDTRLPAVGTLVGAVRVLTVATGIAAVLLAAWLARRPDGWHAAVSAGVVGMLVLPSSIWYHYLVVLLPVGALAWPAAGLPGRVGLLAGALLVYGGFARWLPLATPGAAVMVVAALAVLWPRPRSQRPGETAARPRGSDRSSFAPPHCCSARRTSQVIGARTTRSAARLSDPRLVPVTNKLPLEHDSEDGDERQHI